MSLLRRRHFIAAALAAVAPGAHAHDFFLLPATFKPAAATTVAATVGSAFPSAEIVVTEDRIATATAKGSAGSATVAVARPNEKSLELPLDAARGQRSWTLLRNRGTLSTATTAST